MVFKPAFLVALAAVCASPAFAEITIEDPYFRTATPTSKTGAAFMIITNSGPDDDRLLAARTDIARRVELHTHTDLGDGVMQMGEVEGGFPIPSGGTHVLKRGADHVMLMGLSGAVPDGSSVTLTLVFEDAGEIVLDVPVDRSR